MNLNHIVCLLTIQLHHSPLHQMCKMHIFNQQFDLSRGLHNNLLRIFTCNISMKMTQIVKTLQSMLIYFNRHIYECQRYYYRSGPLTSWKSNPDNKVHGANMGPTWVLSAPDGPHVGPMNLAIWGISVRDATKVPVASYSKEKFRTYFALYLFTEWI